MDAPVERFLVLGVWQPVTPGKSGAGFWTETLSFSFRLGNRGGEMPEGLARVAYPCQGKPVEEKHPKSQLNSPTLIRRFST